MKIAKIIAALGLIAMTAVLIYGFAAGDFGRDGGELLQNPWGVVSMVDLYTGFVLFSCWVFFRERSPFTALIWTVLVMVLGFFTASLYVLIAIFQSNGDWATFWMGSRANG
jgi:hypothetical protein